MIHRVVFAVVMVCSYSLTATAQPGQPGKPMVVSEGVQVSSGEAHDLSATSPALTASYSGVFADSTRVTITAFFLRPAKPGRVSLFGVAESATPGPVHAYLGEGETLRGCRIVVDQGELLRTDSGDAYFYADGVDEFAGSARVNLFLAGDDQRSESDPITLLER